MIALRQGLYDMAGRHLDDEHEEYDTPFVRHLFPDIPVIAVTLAYRKQGLIASPGNPLGIRSITDLVGEDVLIADRNTGSGTWVWFDAQLRHAGIEPTAIRSYESSFGTHMAVATAIASGMPTRVSGFAAWPSSTASSSARFSPNDTTPSYAVNDSPTTRSMGPLSSLSYRHLRRSLGTLPGYDTAHTGEEARSD